MKRSFILLLISIGICQIAINDIYIGQSLNDVRKKFNSIEL